MKPSLSRGLACQTGRPVQPSIRCSRERSCDQDRGPIPLFNSDAHSWRRDQSPKTPTGLSLDRVNPTFDSPSILSDSFRAALLHALFPFPPLGGGLSRGIGRSRWIARREGPPCT